MAILHINYCEVNKSNFWSFDEKNGYWCDNYMLQWWVELDDELRWLFTNRLSATRYMNVKRMGITDMLRRIWLFSANKMKISESVSKQPTQLIIVANKCHTRWHLKEGYLWGSQLICLVLDQVCLTEMLTSGIFYKKFFIMLNYVNWMQTLCTN